MLAETENKKELSRENFDSLPWAVVIVDRNARYFLKISLPTKSNLPV